MAKAKATRSDKTGVWETQYQIINSLRTGKWPCIVSFPIRNGDLEDIDHWLVVQFHHLETYEFVTGKDDIPYMKWKIIQMFETTNQ